MLNISFKVTALYSNSKYQMDIEIFGLLGESDTIIPICLK